MFWRRLRTLTSKPSLIQFIMSKLKMLTMNFKKLNLYQVVLLTFQCQLHNSKKQSRNKLILKLKTMFKNKFNKIWKIIMMMTSKLMKTHPNRK